MEAVVQRYMSRPGTDLDLLDQLQLYEAVLRFEDGESDGVSIPENSVRKTLRQRHAAAASTTATSSTSAGTNCTNGTTATNGCRKSRRHSTGNTASHSQNQQHQLQTTPSSATLPASSMLQLPIQQQTVDEDSSGSGSTGTDPMSPTSTVAVDGTGLIDAVTGLRITKPAPPTGAGVTPGLRRRRERAERQKTFMREQLDASARAAEATRLGGGGEENQGKIVCVNLRFRRAMRLV